MFKKVSLNIYPIIWIFEEEGMESLENHTNLKFQEYYAELKEKRKGKVIKEMRRERRAKIR